MNRAEEQLSGYPVAGHGSSIPTPSAQQAITTIVSDHRYPPAASDDSRRLSPSW